ncbi:nucleotidyl transferase AbiEii/AbiGii toxin family protein [Spirosoma agri]|uniref:Nucleotidyl transferase AbiEii/AbiGii toxin family protein n=1 Tax=Spirosoma agri TaxID=1987381 RepID=A0A6M0IQJ2_9BACT|nr:nucleotidyl transferase AbiEii/AbiGii toxin family protein [Spirosoma agri]NEU70579.1 nucleotidyl transferase AbiEii/AbiGii toxin family protein [Spirosoma agri]
MKNNIASIQSRLKQIAQQEGKAYQLIITRYFQERLLFRVFSSDYALNFCLKGGALLYALEQEKSRPTLDIDFLALRLSNEASRLIDIFTEIGLIEYDVDGVVLDTRTLTAIPITNEGTYPGIRIKMTASLGNIRQVMQIDIGFGDVLTPAPTRMDYPTLLEMDSPQVQAYSIETIIAEKFEAMIDLAQLNSRMKDFYDVYRLLQGEQYEESTLNQAIFNTFAWRQTVAEPTHSLFTDAFATDAKRTGQWMAFLNKSSLDTQLEFTEVMKTITQKLQPIYHRIVNMKS